MRKNSVVAIDFGTSRTKLAYFDPKTEKAELMCHGVKNYLPSYFALNEDEEILLGYDAQKMFESEETRQQAVSNISNIKGLISEKFILFRLPRFRRVKKTPQELLTALFTHLKKEAGKCSAFESEPEIAYLTHPCTFTKNERDNILKASAQAAGFSVELIEEPIAAAQFVERWKEDLPADIILLDCGAGTLHWTYMHRQYIYRSKPKYMREEGESGKLKAGGTRTVGGRNIEVDLARTLQNRLRNRMKEGTRITEDDFEFLCHEAKLRKEALCRNPNDQPRPIEIEENFSVPLSAREIESAIEKNYITPACDVVEPYINNVVKETGRKPALVLTGGCAQIESFATALNEKFGLDCITMLDFEYATVLGAVPLSEKVRSKLSEHMQTQQSERIGTAKHEEITAIKETFDTFGKKIGATIANDVMSCLMELLSGERYNWNLDIGGADSCYVPKKGSDEAGWDHETVRQNIISYFVEELDSIFWKVDEVSEFFQEEFSGFYRELGREALQVHDTYKKDVKQVVRSLLDETLIQIDIRKKIKDTVKFRRIMRGVAAGAASEIIPIIVAGFDKKRSRLQRKAESRRKEVRSEIHDALTEFFKPMRKYFTPDTAHDITPLLLYPETSENAFEMVERWRGQLWADLNAKEESGRTALHRAAEENAAEMVEALLAHGADPNAETAFGYPPLHSAAVENAAEAIEVLLAHGADPGNFSWRYGHQSYPDEFNPYPLDAVEVLLAHGADPSGFDMTRFEREQNKFKARAEELVTPTAISSSNAASRNEFKAYIRYTVVKAFITTAEKLCQSITERSAN